MHRKMLNSCANKKSIAYHIIDITNHVSFIWIFLNLIQHKTYEWYSERKPNNLK